MLNIDVKYFVQMLCKSVSLYNTFPPGPVIVVTQLSSEMWWDLLHAKFDQCLQSDFIHHVHNKILCQFINEL